MIEKYHITITPETGATDKEVFQGNLIKAIRSMESNFINEVSKPVILKQHIIILSFQQLALQNSYPKLTTGSKKKLVEGFCKMPFNNTQNVVSYH